MTTPDAAPGPSSAAAPGLLAPLAAGAQEPGPGRWLKVVDQTRCRTYVKSVDIAASPYDAIFINPAGHSAEKCNFCAHRIDSGLEPACVVICPTQAIMVGQVGTSPAADITAGELSRSGGRRWEPGPGCCLHLSPPRIASTSELSRPLE